MKSQARLDWEARMAKHGYVPGRVRVRNAVGGVQRAGRIALKGIVLGYVIGRGVYSGGRTAYKYLAPRVEALAKEMKADAQGRREMAKQVRQFAAQSRNAQRGLDICLQAIAQDAQAQGYTLQVEQDPNETLNNYGQTIEVARAGIVGGVARPSGIMVDLASGQAYEY